MKSTFTNNLAVDVAIIGAGISGLAVATWLDAAGLEVSVLETATTVGGVMRSERRDGFLLETGPNSLLETTPLVRELITLAGMENQMVYANQAARRRYILRNGKLVPLPMSPWAFLQTSLFSLSAKWRLLHEPFIPLASPDEEESIAQFVRRRLGNEFLDYAVNPFVAGVYAGDPEQLSVAAAFPRLHALEQQYGSLLRGAIRGRRERAERLEKSKDSAAMLSLVDGLGSLPEALHRRLGEKVHVVVRDVKISQNRNEWLLTFTRQNRQEEIRAAQVVITVPAWRAVAMFPENLAAMLSPLREIIYAPLAIVYSGFRRENVRHPLDGFGFLVPQKENRQILGSLWNSTLFPNRAPAGSVLMTTFVGGMRQPTLASRDDGDIKKMVLSELSELLGTCSSPAFVHLRRYDKAIPQYHIGHHRYQELMDQVERRFPGLHFATNYRSGVAVSDCLKQAREIATKIQETIHTPTRALTPTRFF